MGGTPPSYKEEPRRCTIALMGTGKAWEKVAHLYWMSFTYEGVRVF